jgi:hypothetical protein
LQAFLDTPNEVVEAKRPKSRQSINRPRITSQRSQLVDQLIDLSTFSFGHALTPITRLICADRTNTALY